MPQEKQNKTEVFPPTLTAFPPCNYFWLRGVSEPFVLSYLASIREFLYLVHVVSPSTCALCSHSFLSICIKNIAHFSYFEPGSNFICWSLVLVLEEKINSQSWSAFLMPFNIWSAFVMFPVICLMGAIVYLWSYFCPLLNLFQVYKKSFFWDWETRTAHTN